MASKRRRQISGTPHQFFATRHLINTMAQPTTAQLLYNESDVFLAILAINTIQIESV